MTLSCGFFFFHILYFDKKRGDIRRKLSEEKINVGEGDVQIGLIYWYNNILYRGLL